MLYKQALVRDVGLHILGEMEPVKPVVGLNRRRYFKRQNGEISLVVLPQVN